MIQKGGVPSGCLESRSEYSGPVAAGVTNIHHHLTITDSKHRILSTQHIHILTFLSV